MSKTLFRKAYLVLGLLIVLSSFVLSYGYAAPILWYNGDFDGINGLANGINTTTHQANVYDDFIVPAFGWNIGTVWSNNLMNVRGVTQAVWEIRSGLSSGNGGTLIAGNTGFATQTPTGRSGFDYSEYTIEVSGLNVFLSPGTYWLTVAPIDLGSGRSFISTTSGLNAVGMPSGDNDNSFFTADYWSRNFYPARLEIGTDPADFSMGVKGHVIPEPATLSLLMLGLFGFVFARGKRRGINLQ